MARGGVDTMICLLPNCCFLSETSRMLEIYRALREREGSAAGIKVVTHGGPYESLLRAAGVPYDVLGPGVSTPPVPGVPPLGARHRPARPEYVDR
jgi:hypothetical protein